jgi:acyl carrier protein
MEEQLRQIVATIAEVPPDFPNSAHLRDDLGVDSVRALEIVFEIERTFGIVLPEDRYGQIAVFGDIVGLVSSLKG